MKGASDWYSVSNRVLCRIVEDEAVLLDLDSGQYYGLNSVGTRIWELLRSGHSLTSVRDHLVSEYDVTEAEAAEDVSAFLEDLAEKRLLARHRGSRVHRR